MADTIILETTKGPVEIQTLPDVAPGHVARIVELVKEGFYDGIVFQAKGTASGAVRVMAVTKQIAGTAEGGTCDDGNPSNNCWQSYGKDVTLQADWTEVRIRFSDLTTSNSSANG